ncbi:MAG: DNA polymerase I [Bacteriovoracaceae bacterium]|nr:DNA polymerase I [Bacteriovoracaceae bacterium]
MSKKRLIIVDVSNFIFRAFFAIRPMHSPDGTPTNAVYGMLTMLLKLLADHRPTHFFLARDTKGGNFRHELYENYKANRSAPPDDLIPQFALIDQLIQKMNLPTFSHDNYEADDIIGSACVQWKEEFDEIFIASGDKDLMQFVGGNTKLLDTMKDKLYTPEDVFEKMGVKPEQIVDYLSIVGDTSDNIPGMKGIGAVGAAKLLAEYGTLENIIAHREELKGKKVIEAFTEHLETGLLSKKLVQIVTSVDIGHTPEETAVHFYPTNELSEFLKDLGFKSILVKLQDMRFQHHLGKEMDKRIDSSHNGGNEVLGSDLFKTPEKSNVNLIEVDEHNYEEVMGLALAGPELALHCLYNSDDIYARKITRIYFSQYAETVYTIDSNLVDVAIKKIWNTPSIEVIGDNLKRDYVHSLINKIDYTSKYFDICLAHFNINTNTKHDLDWLAKEFLQTEFSADEHLANAERSQSLLLLAKLFKTKMSSLNLSEIYQSIDLNIIPVLAKMEREGISLNVNFLREFEVELSLEMKKCEAEIFKIAGEEINLNSPKQVGVLLFEKLNLPPIKKTKTGYSTDAEVLEELEGMNISEIPGMLLTHREYGKILSTYVKALPELVNATTKRIHTNYNLTVAQTGRLSSTNPNLQNIPVRSPMGEKVRKAFIAKPGWLLLSADYSQVELRLLAHFSEDPTMLKSFQDEVDIHSQTASEVLDIPLTQVTKNDRSMAKTVNFGLMYGQSSFGLASTLKISRTEAKQYIDKYFSRFSSIKTFLDTLKDKAEQTGYAETYHGRKRFLPDIHSQNRTIKAQAERMAINSPLQGTAADIIKLAMIKIDRELCERGMKSKMLLQVHDELIFEVEEDELAVMKDIVRRGMETVVDLKVPLKVDMGIGINWYDLK